MNTSQQPSPSLKSGMYICRCFMWHLSGEVDCKSLASDIKPIKSSVSGGADWLPRSRQLNFSLTSVLAI